MKPSFLSRIAKWYVGGALIVTGVLTLQFGFGVYLIYVGIGLMAFAVLGKKIIK